MSKLSLLEQVIDQQLFEKENLYELLYECLHRIYGKDGELAWHHFLHGSDNSDHVTSVNLYYLDKQIEDANDLLVSVNRKSKEATDGS